MPRPLKTPEEREERWLEAKSEEGGNEETREWIEEIVQDSSRK